MNWLSRQTGIGYPRELKVWRAAKRDLQKWLENVEHGARGMDSVLDNAVLDAKRLELKNSREQLQADYRRVGGLSGGGMVGISAMSLLEEVFVQLGAVEEVLAILDKIEAAKTDILYPYPAARYFSLADGTGLADRIEALALARTGGDRVALPVTCPISLLLFVDPVRFRGTGGDVSKAKHVFERAYLMRSLREKCINPMTGRTPECSAGVPIKGCSQESPELCVEAAEDVVAYIEKLAGEVESGEEVE